MYQCSFCGVTTNHDRDAKPLTAEESIPFIEKSHESLLISLQAISKNLTILDYRKRLSYAMCNIETSINILKKTEEDLKFYLLQTITDEPVWDVHMMMNTKRNKNNGTP